MNNLTISSLNFNKNSSVKSNSNKPEYFQNNNDFFNKESVNLKTSKKITKPLSLNEKNKTKKLSAITKKINKELSNLNFNIKPLKDNFLLSLYGRKKLNFKYLDILKSSSNDLIKLLIKIHNLRIDIYNLPNILYGAGLKIDTAIIDFTNTIYLLEELGVNNENISVFNYCGSEIGNSIKAIANNINQFNELGFNNNEIFNIFKNKGPRIEEIINHFFSNIRFLKYLELDNKCLASIMRSDSPKIKKTIGRLYYLYEQFTREIDILNAHGVNKVDIYKTTFKLSNNSYQKFLSLLKELSDIFDMNGLDLYYSKLSLSYNELNLSTSFDCLVYTFLKDQFINLDFSINFLLQYNNEFFNKILNSLKTSINDILQQFANPRITMNNYDNIFYPNQEERIDKDSLNLSFESFNKKAIDKNHSLPLGSYSHENNSTFPFSKNNDSNSIGNILNETSIKDNDSINVENSIFNLDKIFSGGN